MGLNARHLEDFDDSSRQVTYATVRKHVGLSELKEVFGNIRPWISSDYSVSFYRGKWRGKRAYCVMHSSIHHIWTV